MKKIKYYILATFMLAVFASTAFAKDGDVEICGVIESIDVSQVTLNGISYPLNAGTEYEDENDMPITLNDFSVGELIELRIREGQVDQLEKEDEANCGGGSDDDSSDDSDDDSDDSDDDSDDSSDDNSGGNSVRERLCGKITVISNFVIVVGSRELDITNGTEFESRSGENLTADAFTVGDFVKVDIRNGELHEVEFESSSGCKSTKIVNSNKDVDVAETIKRFRLRGRLLPADGVTTQAKGSARYRSKAKKGRAKDRLILKVKIPLPSTVPAVNAADAASLQLVGYIQRGTDNLAVCQFEFDQIEEGIAEYKIDLRERPRGFTAKKGECDVDPAQPGTQNAIPSLRRGDDVTVVLSDLSALLVGQF